MSCAPHRGGRAALALALALGASPALVQAAPRVDALRAQAQGGSASASAQYALAQHYGGATGEALDLRQAFGYLRQAAAQGHGPAQSDLGFLYFNGNGQVPKDLAQSFLWFGKAARQGVVVAQCMLGDFYQGGWGGARQDFAQAVQWYRRTATTQDRCAPKSQFALYTSYASGQGVRKDPQAALTWLQRAAAAGHPRAQYTLGRAYQQGQGVPRDAELAREWLRKSREGVAPHEDDEHDEAHAQANGHDHGHRRASP